MAPDFDGSYGFLGRQYFVLLEPVGCEDGHEIAHEVVHVDGVGGGQQNDVAQLMEAHFADRLAHGHFAESESLHNIHTLVVHLQQVGLSARVE